MAPTPVEKVAIETVGPEPLERPLACGDRSATGSVLRQDFGDEENLIAPPGDDESAAPDDPGAGGQDPMYEEAVRLVLQMGKASTSTLQRHLRLGYGRAARILDIMQRDGIIGPPDGSKPREVLKRPDWLREVEDQLR